MGGPSVSFMELPYRPPLGRDGHRRDDSFVAWLRPPGGGFIYFGLRGIFALKLNN